MSARSPIETASQLRRIRAHLDSVEADYRLLHQAVFTRAARADVGRMSRSTAGVDDLLVAGVNETNGHIGGQARARDLVNRASTKLTDIESMAVAADAYLRDAALALDGKEDDGSHLDRETPDPDMRAEIRQAEKARGRRLARANGGSSLPWRSEEVTGN